jgi:membrane fusion protein (multidrug efflux system)
MRHSLKKSIASAGILILGLGLVACGKQTQAVGGPGGPVPEVGVTILKEEPVTITTELPGRTCSYLVAEVRPQVSGIIQKRLFTEGADIKAGNTLYQIDPAPYKAAYDNAKANLVRAEANVPSIRSRAERYKELVDIKAVSQQDYDDAMSNLRQAEAQVDVNKAAVETARINLEYTKITAPISGRVGKSNVTVGALATGYQGSSLTTIQQLDPIFVDVTQSSANLLDFQQDIAAGRIKGATERNVKLTLEDGTPYPMVGTLKFSDVTVDPTTGSFILRMVFPNPRHTLLPGMYVRALIQEGTMERAILVPQRGVSRDPKGNPLALVMDASDTVQQKQIVLDRAVGNKWIVASGLKAGDRVVLEGSQKAKPGMKAKVVLLDKTEKEGNAARSGGTDQAKAR